jgi:hypothetical protein
VGVFWPGGFNRSFCCSGSVRALLYTTYIRRSVLRFFNKVALLLVKKKNRDIIVNDNIR